MDAPPRTSLSVADRLWSKVVKQQGDGCWEWIAASDGRRGYGHINVDGVILKAYRVAYELENGPIKPGVEICHRCDNPKCVRPDHLFEGTHHENMLDGANKGRMNPGEKNGMAKLSDADVLDIARRAMTGGIVPEVVAQEFGVSRSCIVDIVNRRRWSRITKSVFGGHSVLKEHLGRGLFTYQLILNTRGS